MKLIKNWRLIASISTLFVIYLSSFYNYLLFHGIAETFSVLIAFAVFLFAWNSREYFKHNYFLFIGVAYLFIGTIDMAHTFSYKGMGVFTGIDANHPTQLWIAARYLESLSLLLAFQFFKRRLNPYYLFAAYLLITLLIFSSIFYWEVFPDCFIEGSGLTVFKKVSEYIISVILLGVIAYFYIYRSQFDKNIYRLLITSAILTVIAELAFTFYVSVFGLSNLIGHFFKIISFYLIYLAVIRTGLKKPYDLLFRELKTREEELLKTNQKLNSEIIDRKQAEELQLLERTRMMSILDAIPDGIYIVSKEFDIEYINPVLKQEFGSIDGRKCYNYFHDRSEVCPWCKNVEVFEGKSVNWEWYSFKNSRHYDLFDTPYLNVDGSISKFEIFHDITERKQAEEKIIASLNEKETLLHEIHHRVKNNMQVINSLLKLQSNNIEDEQTKEILKDSQSRVYAMSAVHETLHGSERLSEIDLKTYLTKITTSVFQTYSTDHRKVKLNSKIEDAPINLNQAYPLGLIINELMSNSLKYAFPDERKGEINVNLNKQDKELELTIMDDGIGMPDNFDWTKSSSLGLKLVRTLVENQLDGSIDMESNNGTKFIIKFNIES